MAAKTLKRIMSDLKENDELPIEGIQLYLTDRKPNDDQDNLFTIHCDIDIKHGIYAGITIHTILQIPAKYPFTAPAMNIAPNFPFSHQHHEHVLGSSICNDMLSNYAWFFQLSDKPKVASGWSNGYTLNVILSQMQIFFADPDYPEEMLPKEKAIEELRKFSKSFKCPDCTQKRTYRHLVGKADDQSKSDEKSKEMEELIKRMICGVTKMDFSTKDIILGYPLLMEVDRFNRIWPKVILETISYDAYIEQIQFAGIDKLDNFAGIKLYSANGDMYNYWIPIYINEAHFDRALVYLKNSISVIRYGLKGVRENDFRADMIFEVLPCLMNKTIVNIMNGTLFHSTAAIQAYCNFLRLYLKLIDMFKLKEKIDKRIAQFIESSSARTKKECGDLGEFIINMFISSYSYFSNEKLKEALVTEFFTRQIYWIEKNACVNLSKSIKGDEMLKTAFEASKTANRLLVFNIEMARFFITDVENKTKILDARLGFLPDNVIDSFQKRVVQIKNISNYQLLMAAIGFSSRINSSQKMVDFLIHCKNMSIKQEYSH